MDHIFTRMGLDLLLRLQKLKILIKRKFIKGTKIEIMINFLKRSIQIFVLYAINKVIKNSNVHKNINLIKEDRFTIKGNNLIIKYKETDKMIKRERDMFHRNQIEKDVKAPQEDHIQKVVKINILNKDHIVLNFHIQINLILHHKKEKQRKIKRMRKKEINQNKRKQRKTKIKVKRDKTKRIKVVIIVLLQDHQEVNN